jgi:RNA polymerase sigma-70 factor (ECF subfamily)
MIDSCRDDLPRPSSVEDLLVAAREGGDEELGRLLEATRRYLLLVANRELDQKLRAKVAPSDLVQETFVAAHRAFQHFSGDSQAELLAWLAQILQHKAVDAGRMYRDSAKRCVTRERPLASPNQQTDYQLASEEPSPSAIAVGSELQQRLEQALAGLSETQRQVIELRSLSRLPFAEVGRRLGRSEDAAGKLWFRAIQNLRARLVTPHDSANRQ